MHSFLGAVGFQKIKKDIDFEPYLRLAIEKPDTREIYEDENGCVFAELKKQFSSRGGIIVVGEYINENDFRMDHYYPYVTGTTISTTEGVELDRFANRYAYAGICEDVRLGITLIFHLQNGKEYEKKRNNYVTGESEEIHVPVILSALARSGKIILPVEKSYEKSYNHKRKLENRKTLIREAKEGNEEAIESLTMEDMDTYTMLSKRVLTDDILSIVDTSIMPYGVESDQYYIIGEIMAIDEIYNHYTEEESYIFTVTAKDITLDVCVPKSELLGVPEVGRRFKGHVWMQGTLDFN